MDEIERDHTLDIDIAEFMPKQNENQIDAQPRKQSPVHPLMEDTPSNYNIPNQRYIQTISHDQTNKSYDPKSPKKKFREDEEIEEAKTPKIRSVTGKLMDMGKQQPA